MLSSQQSRWTALLLAICLVATVACGQPGTPTATERPAAWTELFEGPELDDGWRWLRNDPKHRALDTGSSTLRIDTYHRTIRDIWPNNHSNLLLARREPSVEFMGIDLTPLHARQAHAAGQKLSNVRFQVGDFQALSVADETFDLAFDIDVMEYAPQARLALMETYRVLRRGGWFVSFKHFRKKTFEQSEADVQRACRVVERAMAYRQFLVIDTWLAMAQEIGFQELEVRDLSDATIPHLMTLHTLARTFFKYPRLAKALLRFLSPLTVGSLVAGLLMPFTAQAGAQGFYMIVLGRPRESAG